jgi:hypothetical protein
MNIQSNQGNEHMNTVTILDTGATSILRQTVGLTRRLRALRARSLAFAAMIAILGIALAPSVSLADSPSASWERVRTEDGIVVSRKEVPGSPFVAFRGEGDVDAPSSPWATCWSTSRTRRTGSTASSRPRSCTR